VCARAKASQPGQGRRARHRRALSISALPQRHPQICYYYAAVEHGVSRPAIAHPALQHSTTASRPDRRFPLLHDLHQVGIGRAPPTMRRKRFARRHHRDEGVAPCGRFEAIFLERFRRGIFRYLSCPLGDFRGEPQFEQPAMDRDISSISARFRRRISGPSLTGRVTSPSRLRRPGGGRLAGRDPPQSRARHKAPISSRASHLEGLRVVAILRVMRGAPFERRDRRDHLHGQSSPARY